MRKMYFAMIPKRSFLESAAITVGVGAGLLYGCKKLLGDEQYNKYKAQLKSKILDSGTGSGEFDKPAETADNFEAEDAAAVKNEEDIVDRIRKAAVKGINKVL